MTAEQRLTEALRSPDRGWALRAVVQSMLAENYTPASLYELLEKVLLQRRNAVDHSEAEEEALLDAMDTLTGWCHPETQLFPDGKVK